VRPGFGTLPRFILRSLLLLATAASLASLGPLFASGCEQGSPLPNPSISASSQPDTRSTASPEPNSTVLPSTELQESGKDIWAASVSAVENLGPIKAVIRETWNWETTDTGQQQQAVVSGSASNDIEELLDPPHCRALMTITGSDGTSKIITMDGRTKTTLAYLGSETGGFATYQRRYLQKEPAGLPLPLYAGGMVLDNEDYTELLSLAEAPSFEPPGAGQAENVPIDSDRPQSAFLAQVSRSGDDYVLTWTTAGTQLRPQGELWPKQARWSLVVGSDYLPKRLAIEIVGELEGIAVRCQDILEYRFETLSGLDSTDVQVKVPEGPCEKTVVRELDPSHPVSREAAWGQYWLGPKFGNLTVARAEHTLYELIAGPTDEFVSIVYELLDSRQPADQNQSTAATPTPTVELRSRPLRAEVSRENRQWVEQRVRAGAWQRIETTIGGQSALAYVGPEDEAEKLWNSAYRTCLWIALQDAWLEITLDPGIAPEDILPVLVRIE